MSSSTIIILALIGLSAGILSGFIGIGGGIIIVPALVYILGFPQLLAQGTSIAILLPPIGILAAYNYYKEGNMNLYYAAIIAGTFILGGYFGSKLAFLVNENVLKISFGIIMVLISFKMIMSGYKGMN